MPLSIQLTVHLCHQGQMVKPLSHFHSTGSFLVFSLTSSFIFPHLSKWRGPLLSCSSSVTLDFFKEKLSHVGRVPLKLVSRLRFPHLHCSHPVPGHRPPSADCVGLLSPSWLSPYKPQASLESVRTM